MFEQDTKRHYLTNRTLAPLEHTQDTLTRVGDEEEYGEGLVRLLLFVLVVYPKAPDEVGASLRLL
jgi:hypothetical protein